MITGYYGNFIVRMDEKGRIALPTKLRPTRSKYDPPNEFIVTRGLDNCIALYPEDEWNKILEKFETLDFTTKDFRNFSRQLFSSAVTVTPDRQGRLLIPASLRKQALLEGEIMILGSGSYIEIWNPEKYDNYLNKYDQSYEDVAENLFPKHKLPKDE